MASRRTLQSQIRRLEVCFEKLGLPMSRQPPASPEHIRELERRCDVKIDPSLKELWLYSNGSHDQPWFICDNEENRHIVLDLFYEAGAEQFGGSAYTLYSVQDAMASWQFFSDVDEANPSGWEIWEEQTPDPRIGPALLRHRLRVPFGELYQLSNELLVDGCPSPTGTYCQIVQYVHDPDYLFFVAPTFGQFFERSLYWMERCVKKYPVEARALFQNPHSNYS
jgi:cell wall assembly regulator SMI1